jgi:hypothetical protein
MDKEQWWNDDYQGKTEETRKKKPQQWHSVSHDVTRS